MRGASQTTHASVGDAKQGDAVLLEEGVWQATALRAIEAPVSVDREARRDGAEESAK